MSTSFPLSTLCSKYLHLIDLGACKKWLQLKDKIDRRTTDINKLERRINEITDRLYRDFSESVGVANIREYEENQLKAAQNVAEERLNLSNQLAKLKYQYVFLLLLINVSFF